MSPRDPDERSAQAGEYVLGTLAPDEALAFERDMARDAELQAEVYAWQDRLMSLNLRVRPVPVRPDTWPRLLARLGPWVGLQGTGQAANAPWWQQARTWQWTSGMAVAASLIMASALLVQRMAPPATPSVRYVAVLQSATKDAGWVVEVSAGEAVRLVPLGDSPPIPAGKSVQFWTKPQGAKGPTSLGLIQPGRKTQVAIDRLPGLGEQQLFELTLEPEQGSPLDRPTGPILYVGRTVRL